MPMPMPARLSMFYSLLATNIQVNLEMDLAWSGCMRRDGWESKKSREEKERGTKHRKTEIGRAHV